VNNQSLIANKSGYAKLLEAWVPPSSAGDAVGCLATSFTFSADFFESECLSRFLALDSEPADGSVYLVEREEKLAQLACAAVLIDQHHARGSRNLRWDLLSARLQDGGILHAKLSVLLWSRHARLIVASANLTKDGYRHNHEVFGVLDYYEGSESPLHVLYETLGFLEFAASFAAPLHGNSGPAIQRWNGFLKRVRRSTLAWGKSRSFRGNSLLRIFLVLSGPRQPTVFASLKGLWSRAKPPSRAYVISPFFDPPDSHNAPARELWKLLSARGVKSVQYEVSGEEISESGRKCWLLHAPVTLAEECPTGPGAEVRFQVLELEKARSLHAKCIWLANREWSLYLMGSSNFTRAGLGIGRAANLEANLAYVVCHARNAKACRALEGSWLPSIPVGRNFRLLTQMQPSEGEDAATGDEIILPPSFGEAVVAAARNGKFLLQLMIAGTPPRGWSILLEDQDLVIYSEREWLERSEEGLVQIAWAEPRPPSALRVRWTGSNACAWWPVNAASGEVLPDPEALRELPLEDLIAILTAGGPLHKAIGRLLRKKRRRQSNGRDEIDPHLRVDTSQYLLQRVRRITWALAALRQRLEQPFPSEESLRWRLHGPVGVMALASAVLREAKSDHEKCFLLAELSLELARVTPISAPGCLSKREIRAALREVILDLKLQALQAGSASKPIQHYARRAFKEAGQE